MIDNSQTENENEDVDSTGKVLNFESTDKIIRPNDFKVFFSSFKYLYIIY
jgi:hypothetical protein